MTIYEEWDSILHYEPQVQGKRKGATYTNRRSDNTGGRAIDWDEYYKVEAEAYKDILGKKQSKIEGKFSQLARRFKMKPYAFMGFLDGINSSLNNPIEDLSEYGMNTDVSLDIDFEKLLYNMYKVKAKWLYRLPEWDGIFSKEEQNRIRDEYRHERTVYKKKIGRNEPCPCGSGKKYKNCCGKPGATPKFDLETLEVQEG